MFPFYCISSENNNKKEMEFSFLQVSVAIIALATITQTSFTQPACESDCIKEFLAVHNAAREIVGVPPVKWNSTLAEFAESYAVERSVDCALKHSQGPYGENIALAGLKSSVADSVKGWMDEKPNFDQASNSCPGGECRHYTQVVWRGTTSIGCARAACTTWMFVICNYYPPGNYVGERPY
ncbi:pathogenesis-related protein PRB1-3-like [Ipomoea triloba]|uniref:pathogenesis-related protein PRB1-3-like n=1 Tax=Ipomoea triloba TaxID=35885 RepID=UPI00125E86DC|nr:pathogenesis-related protein PRB1-3-like [Ipomoea triloba]